MKNKKKEKKYQFDEQGKDVFERYFPVSLCQNLSPGRRVDTDKMEGKISPKLFS